MQPTQPGWYWDPKGMPNLFRWWDGEQWTDHVSPIRNVGPPEDRPAMPPADDGRVAFGYMDSFFKRPFRVTLKDQAIADEAPGAESEKTS